MLLDGKLPASNAINISNLISFDIVVPGQNLMKKKSTCMRSYYKIFKQYLGIDSVSPCLGLSLGGLNYNTTLI